LTTKQQYEQALADVQATVACLNTLETSVGLTDLILDSDITIVENALMSIASAIQGELNELAQEQVMTNFLAEMKLVFDKYTATLEVGGAETGYGLSYGEGETAVGIKLTATFDGTTATKEINKSVIASGDLV
jgi:hypothetical protein